MKTERRISSVLSEQGKYNLLSTTCYTSQAVTDVACRDVLELIHDIEHAATLDDPSQLFDAAACIRFATLFKFSSKQKRQLQQQLVREADRIIKAAFSARGSYECFEGGESQWFTKKRTMHDHSFRTYSTYLMVPEKVPWLDFWELPAPDIERIVVPDISVADASAEWISTLAKQFDGKFGENHKDEVEVVGTDWVD